MVSFPMTRPRKLSSQQSRTQYRKPVTKPISAPPSSSRSSRLSGSRITRLPILLMATRMIRIRRKQMVSPAT